MTGYCCEGRSVFAWLARSLFALRLAGSQPVIWSQSWTIKQTTSNISCPTAMNSRLSVVHLLPRDRGGRWVTNGWWGLYTLQLRGDGLLSLFNQCLVSHLYVDFLRIKLFLTKLAAGISIAHLQEITTFHFYLPFLLPCLEIEFQLNCAIKSEALRTTNAVRPFGVPALVVALYPTLPWFECITGFYCPAAVVLLMFFETRPRKRQLWKYWSMWFVAVGGSQVNFEVAQLPEQQFI